VVGGGISGLSAAYFYRKANGIAAKILVLDNHDDFGGHAKRNEFRVRDQTLIGCGGTSSIQNLSSYGTAALELFKDLGIDIPRFSTCYTPQFYDKWGLTHGVFFDKETFGTDRLVVGEGQPDWKTFVAKTPLSSKARGDIVRLQTGHEDYLSGLSVEEKQKLLRRISYNRYLLEYVKADPQVVAYYQATMHPELGVGTDAVEALLCLPFLNQGAALGLPMPPPLVGPEIYPFPDGNASIARMLVRALVPGTAAGHSMEDIVTARMNYAPLDQASSNVRIRLNSTAVRVRHVGNAGAAQQVEVTYVNGGTAYRVRARESILACWNTVIPYLCPEMPAEQKTALAYGVKAPIIFTQVALKNWKPMHKLGIRAAYCPGSYFTKMRMNHPVNMGDYRYPASPEDPMAILLIRAATKPGLSQRAQRRAGQIELYRTPFETFERNVRDQLGRMLAGGGFDARRDIEAITVNRWTHGYAYEYSSLWDEAAPGKEPPNIVARQRFGRIAIANADAAAKAQTWAAIGEADRAVHELRSQG
jgi:spermidine dehydrogenase